MASGASIRASSTAGPKVLATGGGAFMNEETRAAMPGRGRLDLAEGRRDLLLARVRRNNRPLLDRPDPEGVMRELLAERYPVYAQADILIASREGPHEVVIDDICRRARHLVASGRGLRHEQRDACASNSARGPTTS